MPSSISMRKQENILEDLWVSSTSEILDRATASMVNCDETLESISVLSSPKTPCDFDYVPILKSVLIDRPLDDVSHNMQSTEGYNFGEAAQHSPRSSKRQRTDMDITSLTTILETKEPIKIDLFQDLLSKLHLDQGPCPGVGMSPHRNGKEIGKFPPKNQPKNRKTGISLKNISFPN